ncbi:hypothetical protein JZ751_006459, partial [Albula glossodonta]
MTAAERFILIGCLLQGALSREWAIWMPQSIEALSGSCVLIPCRFEIPSQYDKHLVAGAKGRWKKGGIYSGKTVFDSSKTQSENSIQGNMTGDLLKKSCTTILNNVPSGASDEYYFTLEFPKELKWSFVSGVQINVQDSPPKPKLTPVKVEVTEGSSVSLSCSAAAPCPTLPPTLTWTPRLSDSEDQLQENQDQTKSVSSVLTFTASHLHHGQKITCTALYKVQQGDTQKTSGARAERGEWAIWMPQSIEALSGSCVLIPCRFQLKTEWESELIKPAKGIWKKGGMHIEKTVFDSSKTQSENSIQGSMTGDLLKKSCTTILNNVPSNGSDKYYFRLECPNTLKWNFDTSVKINVE